MIEKPSRTQQPDHNGIESVTCSLCGSDDTRLVYHLPVQPQHRGKFNRDIWEIVQCRRCGLIYENPRPDAAALDYFYTFDNPVDYRYVEDWFVQNADFNRKTWNQILRAMRSWRSPGRLLDIGCGAGTFLSEARKAGYQVEGQDVAPYFIDYCRTQLGLTIHAGFLEDLNLDSAGYDWVTAFDVIEHHPYPWQMVSQMRSLVKTGGMVVVGTHDIGNPFARLYGAGWRHMSAIGHLTYFTRESLGKLLESAGFQVVQASGAHTIDRSALIEKRNLAIQFFRLILLRGLILGVYRPVAARLPGLTHWKIQWGDTYLDHAKLMMRAGKQVIMNDNMVILAKAV